MGSTAAELFGVTLELLDLTGLVMLLKASEELETTTMLELETKVNALLLDIRRALLYPPIAEEKFCWP
jgi:hypothetical protein